MEEPAVSDDFSEWEQIQYPFPQTRPLILQSASPSRNDTVVDGAGDDGEGLLFSPSPPPQQTEPPLSPGLPPHPHEPNSSSSSSPTPPQPVSPQSSSSCTNSRRDDEASRGRSESRMVAVREIGKRLRLRLGILSSEVLRAASKVCTYSLLTGRVWSIASVTGLVTAALLSLSLLYVKLKRRWRARIKLRDEKEQLVLLLNQKDEKISQLLVQIAEMNEALSARRRVPVLRVG